MKLDWDGFVNARDLGGVPVRGGGVTKHGVIVRSEHPSFLTENGWRQAEQYGIRTIISLETGGLAADDAMQANRALVVPVDSITHVRVPIEDGTDAEFMRVWARTGLWQTPLYFADALERWPELHGAVLQEIADADGPVLIHCGRGHDRTGIVTLLLLAIAGASAADIAADYLLSAPNLVGREPGAVTELEAALAAADSTAEEAIARAMALLTPLYFERAGLAPSTIERLTTLLTHPAP